MNKPSLRDMYYFEMMVEAGHLGRAAERIGRSQPALTACLIRLEDSVGGPLLERGGGRVVPTEAGKVMLERARMLRAASDEAMREVTDVAQGLSGTLRLGAGPLAAQSVVPPLVAHFLQTAPGIGLDLFYGNGPLFVQALRSGRIDLVLGSTLDGHDDIATEPLGEDVLVAVAAIDHPVFAQDHPCLHDLTGCRWALASPVDGTRAWLESVFDHAGLPRPIVQLQASVAAPLPALAASTPLLTFASRHMLQAQGLGRLREIEIVELTRVQRSGVSYRRSGILPGPARRAVEWLREQGENRASYFS